MKRGALSLVLWALCLGIADAQIAMPDPALINGRAIPAAELPQGTVTVRVVREAIGNNVAGQAVRLTVNGSPRHAVTDDQGRAEFPNLPAGAEVRAEATVTGEALVSETFKVPASGGLRVILVAGVLIAFGVLVPFGLGLGAALRFGAAQGFGFVGIISRLALIALSQHVRDVAFLVIFLRYRRATVARRNPETVVADACLDRSTNLRPPTATQRCR